MALAIGTEPSARIFLRFWNGDLATKRKLFAVLEDSTRPIKGYLPIEFGHLFFAWVLARSLGYWHEAERKELIDEFDDPPKYSNEIENID